MCYAARGGGRLESARAWGKRRKERDEKEGDWAETNTDITSTLMRVSVDAKPTTLNLGGRKREREQIPERGRENDRSLILRPLRHTHQVYTLGLESHNGQ